MDLTQDFPRSPNDDLGGLVHVWRMADKARALKNETLGEYIYPCPLDKIILEFLAVAPEKFADRAGEHDDEGFLKWILEKIDAHSDEEKERINRQILERAPVTEERKKYFAELRDKIDPTRADVKTWVDLIDLEEGRI